jgi:hypothetical protein
MLQLLALRMVSQQLHGALDIFESDQASLKKLFKKAFQVEDGS